MITIWSSNANQFQCGSGVTHTNLKLDWCLVTTPLLVHCTAAHGAMFVAQNLIKMPRAYYVGGCNSLVLPSYPPLSVK